MCETIFAYKLNAFRSGNVAKFLVELPLSKQLDLANGECTLIIRFVLTIDYCSDHNLNNCFINI